MNIKRSIYDVVPDAFLSTKELEYKLSSGLNGFNVDYPNRTRSKIVKGKICEILGYQTPDNFERTSPRFPCQNFDIYIQKSKNLQVWNEEIDPNRRYVIIGVSEKNVIERIRVITGAELSKLDKTGTLTCKYQATFSEKSEAFALLSKKDSFELTNKSNSEHSTMSPTSDPQMEELLPISKLFEKLKVLEGLELPQIGVDQERNRAAFVHAKVCECLGYNFADNGQFPDLKHQLLEIKLQTSPTIDLGKYLPNELTLIEGTQFNNSNVRYAIFLAKRYGEKLIITNLYIVTGKDFFNHFKQFGGNVINKKIQIPLPHNFFDNPKAE